TEIRAKAAEAKLKEQEAIARERAVELELAQLKARGPLKEETIRLAYADPEDIEKTLLGILGQLPAGIAPTVPSGPPPTAPPPSPRSSPRRVASLPSSSATPPTTPP